MANTQYNLHLKGFVGGSDFDRNYVDYVLGKHSGKPVNVLIDSLGGSVATALSIASAFRNHADVSVHFVGMNASAATIAPLIRSVLGSFLNGDDFAVVTTPKRRHGNCSSRTQSRACSGYAEAQPIEGVANERNFATMISEKIAEHLGLPFYDDCAFAPSKHRVGTVFTANNIPLQRNIIVFDEFFLRCATKAASR